MHQRDKSRTAKKKLQKTTYVMIIHHIRREYSSEARGRVGGGGAIKTYLKHFWKRLLKVGGGLICQK